jgi:hypothetical protein
MNNNNRNSSSPPRKKRRWYYHHPSGNENKQNQNNNNSIQQPPSQPPAELSREDKLKNYEKERIENQKQVSKMEQQLHEYFHTSKMPYSFIDDNGIYKFTPNKPDKDPVTSSASSTTSQPTSAANPFMNMTFTPFVPSNASLFSAEPFIPNLWTSIFPFQINPATAHQSNQQPTTSGNRAATVPGVVMTPEPEIIEIRENIHHIDDLIALCDKYPLSDTKKYNINMSAIHAIRKPLTELSNMIGMDTIKKTIVDQILYYLQELHLPETKPIDNSDAKINAEKKDKENNNDADDNVPLKDIRDTLKSKTKQDNQPILNPFATSTPSPFPVFQANAAEFKPLSAKFPPWQPLG